VVRIDKTIKLVVLEKVVRIDNMGCWSGTR